MKLIGEGEGGEKKILGTGGAQDKVSRGEIEMDEAKCGQTTTREEVTRKHYSIAWTLKATFSTCVQGLLWREHRWSIFAR